WPPAAETRVVDQDVYRPIRLLCRREYLVASSSFSQIDPAGSRVDGVSARQLGADGPQFLAAAGHKQQRVSVAGEQFGQLITDATRRPGDDRDALLIVHWLALPHETAGPQVHRIGRGSVRALTIYWKYGK